MIPAGGPHHAHLGPATETLLQRTFASTVMINAKVCAELLGVDTDTLREMTNAGLIRAVRRGKLRGYIEADIRTYLASAPDIECQSTNPQRARYGSTTSSTKVVAFTALQARKRNGLRRR